MIEKILPDLYRIEIPLPRNPLKALNSYLIKGQERFLLIDTGMNREECLRPMLSSLGKLQVDLNRTDFYITHLHADHLGLVGRLATVNSRIYCGSREALIIDGEIRYAKEKSRAFYAFYLSHGFPEGELDQVVKNHPGYRYSPTRPLDLSGLHDGDRLDMGVYSFQCIETPGHSPGHMCLYETHHKVLVAGDHILADITPNITHWPDLDNALRSYLASLKKVSTLDVDLVLPGHRSLFKDLGKRITELQAHHENRLNEVLRALETGSKTSWEIAPEITWDIKYKSWERFPAVQKSFAMGETIAHIDYLEAEGQIRKKMQNGRIYYTLS